MSKTFIVQLIVNGRPVTKGRGKSKKQAEQQAAEEMMEKGNACTLRKSKCMGSNPSRSLLP